MDTIILPFFFTEPYCSCCYLFSVTHCVCHPFIFVSLVVSMSLFSQSGKTETWRQMETTFVFFFGPSPLLLPHHSPLCRLTVVQNKKVQQMSDYCLFLKGSILTVWPGVRTQAQSTIKTKRLTCIEWTAFLILYYFISANSCMSTTCKVIPSEYTSQRN